jgi:hypothetical protein
VSALCTLCKDRAFSIPRGCCGGPSPSSSANGCKVTSAAAPAAGAAAGLFGRVAKAPCVEQSGSNRQQLLLEVWVGLTVLATLLLWKLQQQQLLPVLTEAVCKALVGSQVVCHGTAVAAHSGTGAVLLVGLEMTYGTCVVEG